MRYIILSIFLYSCASIGILEGGEKDTEAPKLLKNNLTETNFSSQTITLEFDEYIEVNNPEKNIKLYPEHSTLKVSITKKKVSIKLDSTLHPNTTYYLKIDNGIKDIHEGNLFSFDYLFSTGSARDTGITTVLIENFKEFKNLKIALVIGEVKDSLRKFPAFYTLPVNTEQIQFKGLKKEEYSAWVFTDNDQNNLPDWYSPIGFTGTLKPDTVVKLRVYDWNSKLKIKKVLTDGLYTKFIYEKNKRYTNGLNLLLPDQADKLIYATEDSALFEDITSSYIPDTVNSIDAYMELHDIILSNMMVIKGKSFVLQYKLPQFYSNKSFYTPLEYSRTVYKNNIENTLIYSERTEELDTISIKERQAVEEDKLSLLTIEINDTINQSFDIFIIKDNTIVYYSTDDKNIELFLEPGSYNIEIYESENTKKIQPFNLINGPSLIYSKRLILKASWEEMMQIKL